MPLVCNGDRFKQKKYSMWVPAEHVCGIRHGIGRGQSRGPGRQRNEIGCWVWIPRRTDGNHTPPTYNQSE